MANENTNRAKGRKRGPKAKKTAQLSQLTVRLDPKIRFAVELMARANHQSLAQAVEWCIRVGLTKTKVNSTGTLAGLVQSVWQAGTAFEQMWRVWKLEPNLLTFDERCVIRLVNQADDLFIEHREGEHDKDGEGEEEKGVSRVPDFKFINDHYPQIVIVARLWAEAGHTHAFTGLRDFIEASNGVTPEEATEFLEDSSESHEISDNQ